MRNDLGIDPDYMVSQMVARGLEYADLNAAALAFEETRQSVYSHIAVGFLNEGMSAAQAEMRAKADPTYRQHLDHMVEARRKADRAKVNYDAAKLEIGLRQTQEATRRAELTLR
jgi:hypothetical protein